MYPKKQIKHLLPQKQADMTTGANVYGRRTVFSVLGRSFPEGRSSLPLSRFLLSLVLLALFFPGLLTACSGPSPTPDPAGTSTQDPSIPYLTEATHGILDTTGTIPSRFLDQLRSRSDDVQTHGYQIAVVFFNNLASDPHQFATTVFNQNGIGFQDTNNGVLFVLYLQKPGTDGQKPWLSYITGAGISGALPDTLMDDYVQTTFVPARMQGQWQAGLLAFYDQVFIAEQDPSIAQAWQTQHPKSSTDTSLPGNAPPTLTILILVSLAFVAWLGISAVVASRQRKNFFLVALGLLGRVLLILLLLSRNARGGSSSGRNAGGSGPWGGGGSSPSSGGDV